MATIDKYLPKLLALEGCFVNDPLDRGGATNMGITLSTWKKVGYDKDGDGDIDCNDIRKLSLDDLHRVLRYEYWNRWRADEIRDQAVAEMLVDWLWSSGRWGIVIPQRLLRVPEDGIVGQRTIWSLNQEDPGRFLMRIYNARLAFLRDLIRRDPSQKRFEKGWVRRVNTLL